MIGATGDGMFGWSKVVALHLMKTNGALLPFELHRVSSRAVIRFLITCGVENK